MTHTVVGGENAPLCCLPPIIKQEMIYLLIYFNISIDMAIISLS